MLPSLSETREPKLQFKLPEEVWGSRNLGDESKGDEAEIKRASFKNIVTRKSIKDSFE